MPLADRRPRSPLPIILAVAMLSALFVFAVTAVSVPGDALGASITKAAACSANLRTSPYTTARLRASIKTDTRVTVATSVTGGSWRVSCAGKTLSGKYWYRISAINGRSVRTLYGVTYLYAASGLFKPYVAPTITKYAACGAYLRTSAATTATSKVLIKTDTKVTIATSVTGGSWSTTCAGKAVAGKYWYRISAINGRSVRTLYGVTYLYAASGLFKPTITATSSSPTPTPPPTPTPTPTVAPSPTPTPTPIPTFPNTTEGIDISHWQGTINWTKVAAAGKRFAYMKASEETTYVDPTYVTNRAQARSAGLHVGAYHFAQPRATLGDAVAQADHFLDTASPTSGDLLPVLDLERTNGLTPAALTAWVQAFMQRVYERTGLRAVIYCSPNFWKVYMANTTWFADNGYQVLWVAHWTTAGTPIMPAGNWGGKGWTFWQYTSDGSVPGITGRVDLNRFNGTNLARVRIP